MGKKDKNSIEQALVDCLSNGDFSRVEEILGESAKGFVDKFEQKLYEAGDISLNGHAKSMSSYYGSYTKGSATDERLKKINEEKEKKREEALKKSIKKEVKKAKKQEERIERNELKIYAPFAGVGETSSTMLTVAGGMGLAISSVSLLRVLWHMIGGVFNPVGSIFGAVVCVIFAGVLRKGINQRNLLEKAKRFAFLCGKKQYIGIEELARSVNQSTRKTLSDIRKMLKNGFFPEGHIDEERTTLMLSDSVYAQYTRTLVDKQINGSAKKETVDTTAREVKKSGNPALDKLINDGNTYIKTLHELNDQIPGEVISGKLDRLETLLKEIFVCVERHPEQMDRMHEVMDYYIPTVIKLVEAYKEYDEVSEAGEEILDAKQQIEKCIDTINDALKKILNNLFRDSVWDVTTDASVLNTMLAQKGLASPFKE